MILAHLSSNDSDNLRQVIEAARLSVLITQARCQHTHTRHWESESIWVWCEDCGLFEDHELEERYYVLRIKRSLAVDYKVAHAALKKYRHMPVLTVAQKRRLRKRAE